MDDLPGLLHANYPEFTWKIELRLERLAGPAGADEDLVQIARRRLLDEGWTLCICLTDLPLHVGRRPVTAHASVSLGVGLVSVPALGAVALEGNLLRAVLSLIEGLLGGDEAVRKRVAKRRGWRWHVRERLEEIASPVGRADLEGDRTLRFVTAMTPGNLRLLLGMVRMNRPWRLVAGLSRALVAALATIAFVVTSPGIWKIMNGLEYGHLLSLTVGSVAVICGSLVMAHGLWEQLPRGDVRPEIRERVLLFNLTTALTIFIGVVTLYAAELVISYVGSLVLITPTVLESEIRRAAGLGDYARLAWLAASLATIGGAFGAILENDAAVREAAYGYRPDEQIEVDRRNG
ncbi:hypothetical protein JYK22_32055, partial [Nonomuraea sp. RK-328]|nr:hypothetical protein [Nonomuraea sp. RK-328]